MTPNQKEVVQYTSACVVLASGIGLVFTSFFMTGDVTGNALIYAGETLTWAGACYGMALYVRDAVVKEFDRRKKRENEEKEEKEEKP